MPAQVEEIEAAEREGIIVRTGLAPVEVVRRDGAVVGIRCVDDAAGRRQRARRTSGGMGAGPRLRGRARRRRRSSSRSARSPIHRSCPRVPASRSAAGPASSPTRDARDGSRRDLRRRRRRVRTEDDHRRGRVGTPRRRIDPRVPARAPSTAKPRSSRRSATATAPERALTLDLATSPARACAAADGPARLVRGHPGRLRRGDRPIRGRPLLPLRRDLRRCRSSTSAPVAVPTSPRCRSQCPTDGPSDDIAGGAP